MAEELPDAPWATQQSELPDAPWAAPQTAEPATPPPEAMPEAFLARVRAGQAFQRAVSGFTAAAKGFKEGFGNEPIGMSEEHVHQLQEAGVYRDPATGRGGLIRLANESILQPAAVIGDLAQRTFSGGVHAIGHIVGQMAEDAELPQAEKLKAETINFLNFQLMRGDHARIEHGADNAAIDRTVGRLPADGDFKAAAKVLGGDATEQNLRDLWQDRGIHPAEAAHDAQTDTFLKQDIAPPSFAAYHGSPHDFESFDTSKIGTGEGAQAYGHGLYFAESRGVAASYQKPGYHQPGLSDAQYRAMDVLDQNGGDRAKAVDQLEQTLAHLANAGPNPHGFPRLSPNEVQDAIKLLKDGYEPPKGSLYRVRINADREHFLDWDKSFSEQSQRVQDAIRKIDPAYFERNKAEIDNGVPIGEKFKRGLLPSTFNPETAAKVYSEAGIPGIKYLDQGSRGAGDGSRNFVVFDHGLIQITEKNGAPLTPTKLPPVRNSPVPEGTPRTELAKTGEAHIDRILESAPTKQIIDNPVINDQYDVPYSAGGSVPLEDPTMFIDRHFPRSMTIDGVTFDPADPFTIHENVEQHVMEMLTKGGMNAQTAYKVAHFEFAERAEGAWYAAHGIDQAKAEEAYRPFIDQIQHENPENPPPNLYRKPYPHDDVNAAKGEPLAEPLPTKAEIAQAKTILDSAEAAGELRAVGAEVTRDMPDLTREPPQRPGSLTAAARGALDQLFGLGRNIQFLLDPMATGSKRAMTVAKDAANAVRRIRWEHLQIDQDIMRRFDIEQQTRMWNAADEESVAQQLGESREHQGLVTLEPEERALVERLHARAQSAWLHAVDTGMVEGEGLPAYTPRMVLNVSGAADHVGPKALNELGRNAFTRTAQMKQRKYMTAEETEAAAKRLVGQRMAERGASMAEIEEATSKIEIARNIRALPLATARLEEAAAWKEMIKKIEDIGRSTGDDTVATFNPGKGWFTIAGNPAFTKWEPAFAKNPVTGALEVRKDDAGNVLFVPKPIYMRDEFRGPMTSILDEGASKYKVVQGAQSLYGALMSIKGKAMTAILNSPLIHNEVVWSKVMEAAGGREWLGFGLYWKGNRIINGNPARASELVDRGLNPMGPRGSYQDISAMMEEPSLQGHKSWTGKLLSFVPGLFDEGAGKAVEQAIQKAGNFYHNTLLWDRVRDVQFGLADHLSDRLVAKGADRLTADRVAAHFSNIIVGSIPKEAMSAGARATANLLLFSRSFTLGNLSTFKQAALGLPKPILAQIERDFGMSADAALGEEAAAQVAQTAKSIARRKAISTIMMSAGLYYVGNAVIQHAFNIAKRDSTIDEEMKGYARRYDSLMTDVSKDPFELRHLLGRLSPTYDNEPAKQDRAHIGYDKDGTAIYARNPMGKFGEEMIGYPTMPLSMVRRKLSPLAGGILDILENDKGFGKKIYDENDTTIGGDVKTAFAVAKHLVMKHLPEGQIMAAIDLLHGEGDKTTNELRVFGPMAGFTASVGAPGGMARGEQLTAKSQFEARFNLAWPDIRKQLQRGDIEGGIQAMQELGVPKSWQKGLISSATNPASRLTGRTLRDFFQYSTPQQRERFERARQ